VVWAHEWWLSKAREVDDAIGRAVQARSAALALPPGELECVIAAVVHRSRKTICSPEWEK
jgi:hypothetical protein